MIKHFYGYLTLIKLVQFSNPGANILCLTLFSLIAPFHNLRSTATTTCQNNNNNSGNKNNNNNNNNWKNNERHAYYVQKATELCEKHA